MSTMIAAEAAHATEIAVRPSKLCIEAGALSVVWQDNDDLGCVIHTARKNPDHHRLPTNVEGGYVLIALDIDGGEFDEVHTEAPGSRTSVEVINQAIVALTLSREACEAATRGGEPISPSLVALGARIEALMSARAWTAEDLAQASGLHLIFVERGLRHPGAWLVDELEAMATAFDVPVMEVLIG